MNAETATLDVGECGRFLQLWMEVTDTPHVTLVSIVPDGKTATRTFGRSDLDGALDGAKAWIAACQANWSNVYFQPNETPADCASKPSKTTMIAALCRFADIDPLDDQFPLAEERDRLMRLAAHLAADPDRPPTVIIDSGNGIQPVWAVTRELLSPWATNRVEAESQAIEEALGSGGTHNVDRLLRLPGTVNYPNARKSKLGRAVTRARLIHTAANEYTIAQAGELPAHLRKRLAGTDLVRPKHRTTNQSPADAEESTITALIRLLADAGAAQVCRLEDLPDELVGRLKHAIAWRGPLAQRWDGSVDDLKQGGHDSSRSGLDMSLAAMLKAAGFTHVETGLLLCAFAHGKANNDRWTDDGSRLRHVARCVIRSHEPPVTSAVDPVGALLGEFNQRYMVVNEAGKAIVYEPADDAILKRSYYTRITFPDLRRLYQNRRVAVGVDGSGKSVTKPVADVWLNDPSRRQYIGGVTFDPSGKHARADTLNLWQGFAVEAWPGTWTFLRDHILKVICAGDHDHFAFLLGWMARMAQNPAAQGEVAIVMRGIEGAGKGILARALLRILGQHGFAITHGNQLTGNFNGHLRDCVFLFADEAFFPGDRSHVGTLKSLITEPFLTIEAKYQNAVLVPNFVHLMMASNEDWVVPASLADRRFFVLDVSPEHANDHAYFAAIQAELDAGGYEAMLHDLLNQDLSHYNPRKIPATTGLQAQKKLSLPIAEHWWQEVLYRGYVYVSGLGLEDYFTQWQPGDVATELLYASYTDFAKTRGERRPMSREDLGKFMRRMKATSTKPRDVVVGEHMADVPNTFGGTSRKAELIRQRKPAYDLGDLATARSRFESATGLTIDWPAV